MNASDLIAMRMHNQQLINNTNDSIKELVSYMGALQSQDFAMSKWAIGIRMQKINEKNVEQAINKGDIIRTHVLRPTWHLVAASDLHWMLQLTATSIKAIMKSNDKRLEISEPLYKKTNKIIEHALAKKHLSRDELAVELKKKNIDVTENRMAHFLMHAELEGIICSGKINNKKHTYALLDERIQRKKNYSKEEALKMLATKYFQSHGPAKFSDFTWWSGLTNKAATEAINLLDASFVKEQHKNETYWLKQNSNTTFKPADIFLLPAYDEYIISYKDRSAVVDGTISKKVTSSNGIFWPVILSKGKVAGTWSRKIINKNVSVESQLFIKQTNAFQTKFKKKSKEYAVFLEKKLI